MSAHGKLTLDDVDYLINWVGGEEGVRRVKLGELILSVAPKSFTTVWKTVKRGAKSLESIKEEFAKKRMGVSERTIDPIFNKFLPLLAVGETEFDLVAVSVKELGFNDKTPVRDVYARAREYGLLLIPAEVVFLLWLAYDNQPKGEWIYMAMEAITGPDGTTPMIFCLGNGYDGLQIAWSPGFPTYEWYPDTVLVFVLPRQK